MDIATIIGLISSLVTIEEAGRGWASGLFHFCKKKRAKKKIVFVEWDAEDETTQRIIDAFKCGMAAKYKEHIFQPDEIDTIIEEFFFFLTASVGTSSVPITSSALTISIPSSS